jgi:hypothetical protein
MGSPASISHWFAADDDGSVVIEGPAPPHAIARQAGSLTRFEWVIAVGSTLAVCNYKIA